MKLSTKKASAAALCMLLTVCISPLQAFAATSVSVGGKAYSAGAKAGDTAGTWAYDGADALALNNYNGGSIISQGDLNISLTGTNTVTGAYNGIVSADVGIGAAGGTLSITGDGSLDVNSTSSTRGAYGIATMNGDISISDTTVNANATSTSEGSSTYAIGTRNGNVTITGSTVSATANGRDKDFFNAISAIAAANYDKENTGIINISDSTVVAKTSDTTGLGGIGIVASAESGATGVPQVNIASSSVTAEGQAGTILATSKDTSNSGTISIMGSTIASPAGAHAQGIADSIYPVYGQTIGTGTGTITQYWLVDGSLNPDVATSVTIAKNTTVAPVTAAATTSPKTADEAPIALLVLSLATAGGALFVSRKKMAR